MSRLAREYSWHVLALVLVVTGVGLFAPLAWWSEASRSFRTNVARDSGLGASRLSLGYDHAEPVDRVDSGSRSAGTSRFQSRAPTEPQLALLRPLVADQIELDPSISETPSLPVERSALADKQLLDDPIGELRLSAAPRPNGSESPDLSDIAPLRQPTEFPDPATLGSANRFPLTKAWAYPAGLMEQLQELAESTPPAAEWTTRVLAELDRLLKTETLADASASHPLTQLRTLADEAKALALAEKDDDHARAKILRAGYALVRRLVIWDEVHALSDRDETVAAPIVDRKAWVKTLADVDSLLQATGAASNWRNYLRIDQAISQLGSSAHSPPEQRQLARDILHRMHSTQLSHEQELFLKTPPFAALARQLEAWAAQTPDFRGLLTAMEQYEREDASAPARLLAAEFDAIRWSADPAVRELADTLNAYYRNANVRVAISVDLINRMMPPHQAEVESVQDMIQGACVLGQSHTNTQLRLALVPDQRRWNIGLEAIGQVASDTSSTKGPATFHQNGWSFFRARKRLTVDRRGIRLFNAEAEANANNNLSDFQTDFDGIPLLGGIARAIARNQYDTSQSAAKVEVEGRIIVRATSQLDREVAAKLEQAKRDFQIKLIDPLRKLQLEPTAVDMETTAERLIARYRIAARDQVSAHTPRPQAPGDSLLSVQIHQSAMNNVLEKLRLNGRRVELRELFKEMTARFRPDPVAVPEDLPEDVYVTFADDDPVRIDCHDGLVRLTIRLKELSQGAKNRWTDFTVRGYYAPSADQLDANLEREGIIELIGDGRQIPIGQQVALRGIFARVLSRNRKLHVVNKQITEAPGLRDQQVTQFVIHDGWIGVALGPRAPGRQAAMHPRAPFVRETSGHLLSGEPVSP